MAPGSTEPDARPPDERQAAQHVVRLADEAVDRERPRVDEEHADGVVDPALGHAHDGDRLGGAQHLEMERAEADAGEAGGPHAHGAIALDGATGADHAVRRAPEGGGGADPVRGDATARRRSAPACRPTPRPARGPEQGPGRAGSARRPRRGARRRPGRDRGRGRHRCAWSRPGRSQAHPPPARMSRSANITRPCTTRSGDTGVTPQPALSGRSAEPAGRIPVVALRSAYARPGALVGAATYGREVTDLRVPDAPADLPRTLGALRASGHEHRTVKEELRDNLLARLRRGRGPRSRASSASRTPCARSSSAPSSPATTSCSSASAARARPA